MKAIDEIEHACPPEIVHFRQFLEETEFMLPTPEKLSSPGKGQYLARCLSSRKLNRIFRTPKRYRESRMCLSDLRSGCPWPVLCSALVDYTFVKGVKRRSFRLHPRGPLGISEGCITLNDPGQFDQLHKFLIEQKGLTIIPGTTIKYYGTVEVESLPLPVH